ncbi:hypothetical protein EYF80_037949 [Liparis tanakae]|uniref:Uncharacterized protein n=1 Tax=Liparis tanakae TaxID=230148 RepID=A0A4Z2GG23_9TELE|nr:hypothetical protein EYF80_037949 [Liparis tanakae]
MPNESGAVRKPVYKLLTLQRTEGLAPLNSALVWSGRRKHSADPGSAGQGWVRHASHFRSSVAPSGGSWLEKRD